MAEVVGFVASGASVAQIAGQLLSCMQHLRMLCRALRDAPEELQDIINELEILGEIFYQLGTFKSETSQNGYSALQASLTRCRKAASKLEALATPSSRTLQSNQTTPWSRLKAVAKMDETKKLKTQLEAAKSLLQLAMTCYSLCASLSSHNSTSS